MLEQGMKVYRPIRPGMQDQASTRNREIACKSLRILFLIAMAWALIPALIGAGIRGCTSFYRRDFTLHQPTKGVECAAVKSLKIRTFNTALMPEVIVVNNRLRPARERVKVIARELLSRDDDVICMQECFNTDCSDYLANELRIKFPYIICNVGPRVFGLNSGLFVASKLPISGAHYEKYDELFGECRWSNKGNLSFTVEMGNGRVANIMTTHFQASMQRTSRHPNGSIDRRKELVEIIYKKALDYQKTHPADYFLVAGDFNIIPVPDSEWIAFKHRIEPWYNEEGRQDLSTVWLKDDMWDPSQVNLWGVQPGKVLDHVGRFRGIGAEPENRGYVIDPMAGSSDHLALARELSISSLPNLAKDPKCE